MGKKTLLKLPFLIPQAALQAFTFTSLHLK